jgi:hypothetical protein
MKYDQEVYEALAENERTRMNNKPVAWTDGNGNYFDKYSFFPVDDLIPLYTHPVKELTDEEIYDAYEEYCKTDVSEKGCLQDFARAILRKAQDK